MQHDRQNIKILIVEDEVLIAADLESRLKSSGFKVAGRATSAERALEMIENVRPDLVLMDIVLKGEMDGIKAAEVVRDIWGVPVVFVTAYADARRLERAKLARPFGYVLKPFQDRDLQITIDMALYVATVEAERQKAEDATWESAKKFQALFHHMTDGFAYHQILVDDEGRPADYVFLEINRPLNG